MKLSWTIQSGNKGTFECNDTLAATLLKKGFAIENETKTIKKLKITKK